MSKFFFFIFFSSKCCFCKKRKKIIIKQITNTQMLRRHLKSTSLFGSDFQKNISVSSLVNSRLSVAQQQKKSAYEDDSSAKSEFSNTYENAKSKPKEGRGVMGRKVNKLIEEGEFFVHEQDGEGTTDFGRRNNASSSSSPGSITAIEDLTKDQYASESPTPANLDTSKSTPGDTFGTYETRQPFLRPLKRNLNTSDNFEFRALMPTETPPERCVAPDMLRLLASKFNMTHKEVLHLMIDVNHDINKFLYVAERKLGKNVQRGDYGLVALESYEPETFCLVNYCMPNYESTKDEECLEALHELTLSAAEIPLDTPRREVAAKFTTGGWTTDSDESCAEILQMLGAGVRDVILLPFGEYSSQGFFIAHPDKNFGNIGTGAAAVCMDLRSGIHKRFRFHAERNADSIAEHLVREQMHFDQWYVNFLRQSFWFNPEYSVEDFIRYKESLLMPSATIFEVRTAVMLHNCGGRRGYRNIAEIEKVKIAQHKLEKGGKEQQMSGNLMDANGLSKVINAAQTPQSSQYVSQQSGKKGVDNNYKEISLENKVFDSAEANVHAERIWRKYYRNNYY